jgi:hypothetical protein
MRKSILIYLAVGGVISAGTVVLGWWFGETEFVTSVRWQVSTAIMLGAELVFLLFIPANKGGQQFGPHGTPSIAPVVSSGVDFDDDQPSRRLGDWRWLLIGIPIVVTGAFLLISM